MNYEKFMLMIIVRIVLPGRKQMNTPISVILFILLAFAALIELGILSRLLHSGARYKRG